jgi:hypothetical protein
MELFDKKIKKLRLRLGIDEIEKLDPIRVSGEIRVMQAALNDILSICEPRLIMGGIRYHSKWRHHELIEYMQKKLDLFKTTGNFEFLCDFVNFCAIESVLKTHPNYHFNPTDRKS